MGFGIGRCYFSTLERDTCRCNLKSSLGSIDCATRIMAWYVSSRQWIWCKSAQLPRSVRSRLGYASRQTRSGSTPFESLGLQHASFDLYTIIPDDEVDVVLIQYFAVAGRRQKSRGGRYLSEGSSRNRLSARCDAAHHPSRVLYTDESPNGIPRKAQ